MLLGENCWSWEINSNFSYYLPLQVDLPRIIDSWYPHFIIEGIDNQGLLQEIDLYFNRPIISTTLHPIYDARLARSNWNIDEWKIEPIKILLNKFGLDSSTLGIEVQIPFSKEDLY